MNDYEKMFKDENNCDVEFKVVNENKDEKVEKDVFRAHKCILSQRSKVFKKMFENEMKED